MKRSLYLLFLIVLDSFCFIEISAHDLIIQGQDTFKSPKTNIWLNLGLGYEDNRRSEGCVSSAVSLSLQKAFHLITVRYIGASEVKYIWMKSDILKSYNLMYGLIKKNQTGHSPGYFSVSTGIDYSTMLDLVEYGPGSTDHNLIERKRFGVPVDVQVFRQGKWIGIGLNGYIVINSEFTFYGVLVCLQLGKLR